LTFSKVLPKKVGQKKGRPAGFPVPMVTLTDFRFSTWHPPRNWGPGGERFFKKNPFPTPHGSGGFTFPGGPPFFLQIFRKKKPFTNFGFVFLGGWAKPRLFQAFYQLFFGKGRPGFRLRNKNKKPLGPKKIFFGFFYFGDGGGGKLPNSFFLPFSPPFPRIGDGCPFFSSFPFCQKNNKPSWAFSSLFKTTSWRALEGGFFLLSTTGRGGGWAPFFEMFPPFWVEGAYVLSLLVGVPRAVFGSGFKQGFGAVGTKPKFFHLSLFGPPPLIWVSPPREKDVPGKPCLGLGCFPPNGGGASRGSPPFLLFGNFVGRFGFFPLGAGGNLGF